MGFLPLPVRILYGVTALAWMVIEIHRSRVRRSEATTADRGSLNFLRASWVLGFAAAIALRTRATGPYRLIRHPSYAGLLAAFVGFGFMLGDWWSLLALTAATACGVVRRIMVEERALTGALGARYADYAATHKRLIPFVW
jgi:protein-S-isoprenylcysteine O-methyltransferase Ste14